VVDRLKMAGRPTVQLEENPLDQQLVTFNVGGTIYQVSRTLLDSHPDTMLARIASDTWNTGNGKAIFIERNGTRFECVLDYLRDGSVTVPFSVSKEALKTDLDYYGVRFKASHIRGLGSLGDLVTNTRDMARDHTWRAKEGELALEVVGLFVAHGSFNIHGGTSCTSNGQELKTFTSDIYLSKERMLHVNDHLRQFGLAFDTGKSNCVGQSQYIVRVLKNEP
jgi:hypothetical protein